MSDTMTKPVPWEVLYRWVLSDPRQIPPEVCEDVERLRALAAFTREDVDTVQCGVLALQQDGCPLIAAELQSVLERLAKLLPPESDPRHDR